MREVLDRNVKIPNRSVKIPNQKVNIEHLTHMRAYFLSPIFKLVSIEHSHHFKNEHLEVKAQRQAVSTDENQNNLVNDW